MKKTVADLKKIIKRRTSRTGYVLSKKNPYYANSDQLEYMQQEVNILKEEYDVTEKQLTSLNNWIQSLKVTYLLEL